MNEGRLARFRCSKNQTQLSPIELPRNVIQNGFVTQWTARVAHSEGDIVEQDGRSLIHISLTSLGNADRQFRGHFAGVEGLTDK